MDDVSIELRVSDQPSLWFVIDGTAYRLDLAADLVEDARHRVIATALLDLALTQVTR